MGLALPHAPAPPSPLCVRSCSHSSPAHHGMVLVKHLDSLNFARPCVRRPAPRCPPLTGRPRLRYMNWGWDGFRITHRSLAYLHSHVSFARVCRPWPPRSEAHCARLTAYGLEAPGKRSQRSRRRAVTHACEPFEALSARPCWSRMGSARQRRLIGLLCSRWRDCLSCLLCMRAVLRVLCLLGRSAG